MYKPEAGPNPNSGQFKDIGTIFDTFDTDTGRLYTCDNGSGLNSGPGPDLD
jgi:ABC-type proline/glycine betaine transport system substrate-binding protein